jgi:APA family basic amino acid/polyamine antiporter
MLLSSMEGFGITIDWLAPLFIMSLCLILLLGTSEGTLAQNISMGVYLILISFIVIAGGAQVNNENFAPYFPYGSSGVFFGASSIFFSFVGFDMVASLAEEAVNPQVDLPVGIVGSIGVATGIYVAMSTVLVGMVSYTTLDPSAPFSSMFESIGWGWASKIVAIGAVIGCTNSNYGGLLGQSRIFVTMARAGLLPKLLSKMSSRLVPYWSIIVSGLLASVIALFVDLSELWDLVSMGTLISFGAVCLGTIWRRYYGAEESPRAPPLHQATFSLLLALIIGCGFACGFSVQYSPGELLGWAIPLGCFFPITASFHLFPQLYQPSKGFSIPMMPWIPACGMMVNGFLIGLLGRNSNIFWAIWMGVCILIYLAYGLHNSQGEGSSGEIHKQIENSDVESSLEADPKYELEKIELN